MVSTRTITYTGSGNGSTLNLFGPLRNVWTIGGANAGSVNAITTFSSTDNLVGGNANDIFRFRPGGKLHGFINGTSGSDFLDYSAEQVPVVVNLAAGTASFITGGVQNFNNVIGSGVGGDRLTGSAAGGILEGHGGGNKLTSGAGSSLLIGGLGRNLLTGGPANDILINGRTKYDANYDTLTAILATWQSSLSYDQGIAALSASGPDQLKVGTTVFVNGPRVVWGVSTYQSSLAGNGGLDWFITISSSTIVDRKANEVVTTK